MKMQIFPYLLKRLQLIVPVAWAASTIGVCDVVQAKQVMSQDTVKILGRLVASSSGTLPKAEAVFGKSFAVQSMEIEQQDSLMVLRITFEGGGIPEVRFSETTKSGRKKVQLTLLNTTGNNIKIPELKLPFSHLTSSPNFEDSLPGISVFLYLEGKVPVQLSSRENVLSLSIFAREEPITSEPAVLNQVIYQVIDEYILTCKFELTHVPEQKEIFLLGENREALLYLHNTRFKNSPFTPPELPSLTGFISFQGETAQGIPYVKLSFSSKNKLIFLTREDENRYFLDLFMQAKPQSENAKSEEEMIRALARGSRVQENEDETSYMALLKRENPELYMEYVNQVNGNRSKLKKISDGKILGLMLVFFCGSFFTLIFFLK